MFSDRDPANKGRDSIEMLRAAVGASRAHGWRVQQVDVAIVAEKPEDLVASRVDARPPRRRRSASSVDDVSVKGKTNEGMGWIGRGEGIACIAVATIVSVAVVMRECSTKARPLALPARSRSATS